MNAVSSSVYHGEVERSRSEGSEDFEIARRVIYQNEIATVSIQVFNTTSSSSSRSPRFGNSKLAKTCATNETRHSRNQHIGHQKNNHQTSSIGGLQNKNPKYPSKETRKKLKHSRVFITPGRSNRRSSSSQKSHKLNGSLVQRTCSPVTIRFYHKSDTREEDSMRSGMALPNLDGIDVDSFKKRKRNNSIEKRNGPKDMNINEHDEPFRKLNRISLSVFNRQDINVQIITPTSSGINEAARIIRRSSEIVSVPTEKSYSLFCSVPFQKPRMDATRNRNHSQGKESWNTLLESISTQADEASVYLFHPAQAYNFVSFSARKKFLYKSRSESNESSTSASNSDGSALLSAVSFSESHEVLNRLSSAFWPGFVTIYAPVRTRRLKASSICSNDDKNNLRGHGSTDSLTSFSSLSSEETGTDFSDLLASTPVVPDSILHSNEDLMLPVTGDERGQKCYVGMRCPSHPIARKILLQSYGQSEGKLTSRLKGAIIGIDSSKTCRDVCENLHSTKMANTRVHVVNGEDCREQFSVPPCQFGDLPSVSLVIDTPSRTVYLLRDTSQHEKDPKPATPSYFDVTMHQVSNALCQSIDCKNVKNRVMAAVMSKWKVAEIERPLKVGK